MVSGAEFHAWLVRLAMEAWDARLVTMWEAIGEQADIDRAAFEALVTERMAQAAQAYVAASPVLHADGCQCLVCLGKAAHIIAARPLPRCKATIGKGAGLVRCALYKGHGGAHSRADPPDDDPDCTCVPEREQECEACRDRYGP